MLEPGCTPWTKVFMIYEDVRILLVWVLLVFFFFFSHHDLPPPPLCCALTVVALLLCSAFYAKIPPSEKLYRDTLALTKGFKRQGVP